MENFSIIDSYIDSLLTEIDSIKDNSASIEADTIYFGGGTPSILKPHQAETAINRISRVFKLDSDTEITMEMNPDDLVPEKLTGFINAGVNRIVLGVQSFDCGMRETIGRRGRTVTESELDLFFSSSGYTRCIDIIAGIPGQSRENLLADLSAVAAYRPEHISLYLLSVDDDTPLGKRFHPDDKFDSLQADLWGNSIDFLEKEGYIHYEISNYALPGFESRHNSKYWDFSPYYGFGAGAHSYVDGVRYSCGLGVSEYINSRGFRYNIDSSGEGSIIAEFFMTTLRRKAGFSPGEFFDITGSPLPEEVISLLKGLVEEGKINFEGGRYFLTRNGLFFADSVIYKLAERFL